MKNTKKGFREWFNHLKPHQQEIIILITGIVVVCTFTAISVRIQLPKDHGVPVLPLFVFSVIGLCYSYMDWRDEWNKDDPDDRDYDRQDELECSAKTPGRIKNRR